LPLLSVRFDEKDPRDRAIRAKLTELAESELHSRDAILKLAAEERWERFKSIVKVKIEPKYFNKIEGKAKRTGKSFETIAAEYLEKGARMDADFAIEF